MLQSIKSLESGLESSCEKTPEFIEFAKTFKSEFTKELQSIGAKLTNFNVGHFYLSGFFSRNGKCYYFSLSDVREMEFQDQIDLLYRTAKDSKDFQGGHNCYVRLETGMAKKMVLV